MTETTGKHRVGYRETSLSNDDLNTILPILHTNLEVIELTRHQDKNSLKVSAGKVELRSKKDGVSEQNQNQQHNTVKQAKGPNTKR